MPYWIEPQKFACAGTHGCQCANCRKPITVDGHPHARPQDAPDVVTEQSGPVSNMIAAEAGSRVGRVRKPTANGWQSDWRKQNTLRTLVDTLNSLT